MLILVQPQSRKYLPTWRRLWPCTRSLAHQQMLPQLQKLYSQSSLSSTCSRILDSNYKLKTMACKNTSNFWAVPSFDWSLLYKKGFPTLFKVYSNSWLGEMFDLHDCKVCFASISYLSRYCRNFGLLNCMFMLVPLQIQYHLKRSLNQ